MKFLKGLLAIVLTMVGTFPVSAQQPQMTGAPIYQVNAKAVNGVAPGYAPLSGGGLVLNIGPGTSNCANTIIQYAGGNITLTASNTNYVYLDTSSSCAVGHNTTGFTSTTVPIATVVVGSSSFTNTNITDVRTFMGTTASSPAPAAFGSITSGSNTIATMHVGAGASLDSTGGPINATAENGVSCTGTPTTGQVCTATGSTTATWQTPAGGATSFNTITNGTNTNTLNVGTGGSIQATGSGIINATAENGVSCTGTPTTGQACIATGSTTATWQTITTSGVQYNANTTPVVMTGDSQIGDDGVLLGNLIAATSINCNVSSSGVCVVTNSGTNGLSAGDWVRTDTLSSPSVIITPQSGFNIYTTGQTEFQVIGTGLSTSQFEFAYTGTTGTCSSSCGNIETANFFLPYQMYNLPFFKGHSVIKSVLPSGTPSIITIDSNFSTIIGTPASTPAYLIIIGEANSVSLCSSAATIEGHYQSVWAKAHAQGWTVVQSTILPRGFNLISCSGAFTTMYAVNDWMRGQGKSIANKASGQYIDIMADGYSLLSNNNDPNINAGTSWTASAFAQYAALFNNAMATQGTPAHFPLINPVLATPNIGDASGNTLTFGDGPTIGGLANQITLGKQHPGLNNPSTNILFNATSNSFGAYTGTINLGIDSYINIVGGNGAGTETSNILGPTTAPTGTCASVLGGSWSLTKDGKITRCPSGGGTYLSDIILGSLELSVLNQQAASNTGGTCAMSTSTSCTITIAHTYTTPVCIVTQQSATLTGGASGCTVSGTTVTITSAVANSETWGALVFGNPN